MIGSTCPECPAQGPLRRACHPLVLAHAAGWVTGRSAGLGGPRQGLRRGPSAEAAGGAGSAVRRGGGGLCWAPQGTWSATNNRRAWYSRSPSFGFRRGGVWLSAEGEGPAASAASLHRSVAWPGAPRSPGVQTVLPTMASGDDSPIFEDDESLPYSLEKMTDLVAVWDVALSDGVHKIEFEHGTTSGKRVVYVDGKEAIRREWMFKLVGKETFCVGAAKAKATINIDAVSGFAYEYTLEINGKSLKKYMENRSKTTNTWVLHLDGEDFRVVLEKDTMDVWCNGNKMETAGEFVDDGTETHFSIGNHDCYIKAVSSGKRKEGIIHTLIVDNREIPEIS